MTQSRKVNAERFANALGASRVVPLEGVSSEGPLGLLWLRAAVERDVRRTQAFGAVTAVAHPPSSVYLDSFYEGFDSPADCLESVEAA